MTEEEKIKLENHVKVLIEVDNESLMGHYTGAVRTHEYNIYINGENREWFNALIDKLWNEILKRMNP
jgi:hypothetical protein